MLPSPSTHRPSKLCWAFMKAQKQTDKVAHLRSNLTSKANSSTLQKGSDFTPLPPRNWHPNWKWRRKPSLPEVELHCQKLKEFLLFVVILIKHACLLQKYLMNPSKKTKSQIVYTEKQCDFTRTRVTIGDKVPHPFPDSSTVNGVSYKRSPQF